MAAPTSRRTAAPARPFTVTTLGVLQFLVAGAVVIYLLGEGQNDGELGAGDIGLGVAAACVGGAVFSATWGGGRIGWWAQLVLALVAVAWGAVTMATDDVPGPPALVVGILWLALALLPSSRTWFLRDTP